MKYSKATNYALHAMLYFVASPAGKTIGMQPLAEMLSVSSTYLSKILTKLVKAGIVASTPGVSGGYRLLGRREELSFLSVIHAIEGTASLFYCDLEHANDGCLIQGVMVEAERNMEGYLREKKLIDLVQKLDQKRLAELAST